MKRLAALALLSLAALPARAGDPELKFEKYKLQNGLTVILSEDHRLPQVAVDIWYHVGAANQTPGKSGFAHLFEHMMFSGSKHVQPSPFTVLQKIGTIPGSMANGTTNFDRTNYFEVVPASELATALWIESDRMAFLLDTLDEQKLKTQRDVVSNERRQSYENRPYGMAQLKMCDLLFPQPHPYYDCVIGVIPEIQAASVDDLKTFFRAWYGPQNASLAIVGDFDPASAKALVEKYFGPVVNAGELPPRPDIPQPQLAGVVKETITDPVAELPQLRLIWTGVKQYADDEAAGDVLAGVLGGGKSSRLHRSLVFEKQVAADADADDTTLGQGGMFIIEATAKEGHTAAELLPLAQAEIDRIKQSGPTPEELERAKRKILARFTRSLETLSGFGGKADVLNRYQTYLDDPGYLPRDLARFRAVTAEQVQAFARKYLLDDKRIELTVNPAAKKAAAP